MLIKKTALLFTVTLSGLIGVSKIEAGESDPQVTATIEENDYLNKPWGNHQDRHYTQGLKFIYLDGSEAPPWWAKGFGLGILNEKLPGIWMETKTSSYGLVFGQNIYTPADNLATALITSDRPYAGWMYLGVALQRQGETAGHIPVLESFELNLGVVGPEAQGGRSQTEVHQLEKIPTFGGWGNQIKTEPAFVFKYGRAWKFAFNETSSHYFDFIPHIGANLGSVMVLGDLGTTARLGFNLPRDFGVQTIDSPILLSNGENQGPVGCYIFGQVEGRAVGRNIFLDGNTYTSSFHVQKKPLVGDFMYGAVMTAGKHFELSWTFITRTAEFDGQAGKDKFGSITAKIKWGF